MTSARAGMYAAEFSKSHPICESEATAGLNQIISHECVCIFECKYESNLDEILKCEHENQQPSTAGADGL